MRYFVVMPPRRGDGATLYRRLDSTVELRAGSELFLDGRRMRVDELSPGVSGTDATIVCVPADEPERDAVAG